MKISMKVIFTIVVVVTVGFCMLRGGTFLIQQNSVKKGLLWFSIAIAAAGLNLLIQQI